MFHSSYNKILHDPECQSHCCSGSMSQSLQANNYNNMEQYPMFTAYNSDESNSVSNNSENQFLCYNVTACNRKVPEFQEDNVELVGHELIMVHSELDYEESIKKTRYDSCSININSEVRYKQKSYKGITKRKRKRTIFSTEQIIVMEGVFKKRPYVCKEERQFLSSRLNITEKAIKIWFQNRRRVTEKRDRDQSDSYHSDSTNEECNDYNTRLDYIESRIRQNTDEFGFVTLESKDLTELVRIIDSALSNNIDCHNSLVEIKNNDSYLMYEPVSPESLSDDCKESENISKWKPSKPEESLQRLIDIHTILYG